MNLSGRKVLVISVGIIVLLSGLFDSLHVKRQAGETEAQKVLSIKDSKKISVTSSPTPSFTLTNVSRTKNAPSPTNTKAGSLSIVSNSIPSSNSNSSDNKTSSDSSSSRSSTPATPTATPATLLREPTQTEAMIITPTIAVPTPTESIPSPTTVVAQTNQAVVCGNGAFSSNVVSNAGCPSVTSTPPSTGGNTTMIIFATPTPSGNGAYSENSATVTTNPSQ